VDGDVAEVFDGFDFGDEGGAGELLELGVEYVGGEVVAVGRGEPGVVAVDPVDGEFEGAAGVEAGGAGIGVEEGFGFGGGDVDFGPLGGEVLEVGGAGHWGLLVRVPAGGRSPFFLLVGFLGSMTGFGGVGGAGVFGRLGALSIHESYYDHDGVNMAMNVNSGGVPAVPVERQLASLTEKPGEAGEGAQLLVFNPIGGGGAVYGNRAPDLNNVVFRLGRKLVTCH
jgi:hypothetical protein